jgi:hypothetical protein
VLDSLSRSEQAGIEGLKISTRFSLRAEICRVGAISGLSIETPIAITSPVQSHPESLNANPVGSTNLCPSLMSYHLPSSS